MREFLREHPPLLGLGAAILIFLTVFLGADLLSVLVGYHSGIPAAPLAPAASPSTSPSPDPRTARNLETLMRRDRPPAASSSPSSAGDEPEGGLAAQEEATPEGVDLQGVMLGGGVGIAVLQVEGRAHTLSVGDSAAGYTVVEIQQDHVVLRKDGRTFPLGLSGSAPVAVSGDGPPVLPDPEAVPPPPAPAPAAGGAPVLPEPAAVAAEPPPPGSAPAAASGRVTRQEMDAFLEQGAALARDVRGVAAPGDGRGVRLQFRNPSNALARLGLKDGDVVLSLNGEPIRTPEELYNSYLILRNTPSVDIEVLRDGKPTSVRYDFPEN